MTTLRVDPGDPDPDAIGLAASALAAGRLVVVPTDSVYGIAADPALPTAVGRLFEAKGRPRSLPIAVLAGTLLHVERLVELQGTARELAVARWPGPLTLVLRRKAGVDWDLGDTGATLAVRLPDHPVALALLTQTARPTAAGPSRPSSATW